VAFKTGLHGNIKIVFSDSNRIVEFAGGKFQGMPEAVLGLVKIFHVDILRSVT